MNCPRCQHPLNEANYHLDTCEDIPGKDLLQIVATHGDCGYTGFVMMTPASFVEVPS
jgi:hypothetical protein